MVKASLYYRMVRYVLSLDEGTTSARAVLYDRQGRRVAMESAAIECFSPQQGWVEQDAMQIWRAQLDAARRAIAAGGADATDIAAIGITNQRETTVVWDRRTGEPVSPAIVWQCRRTAHQHRANPRIRKGFQQQRMGHPAIDNMGGADTLG